MMKKSKVVFKLGNDMIEVVQEFHYLGNVVGSNGDIQSSVMARICADWRKFKLDVSSTMWDSSVIEAKRSFI